MVKYFLGEIDPTKPNISEGFEEKLPKVVDYFAKLYGEEYREQFSEKLNNCTYIFVNRIKMRSVIGEYFSKKLNETIMQIYNKKWGKAPIGISSEVATFCSFNSHQIKLKLHRNKDLIKILKHFYKLNYIYKFKTFKDFINSNDIEDYIKQIQFELRPLKAADLCFNKYVNILPKPLDVNTITEICCEYFHLYYFKNTQAAEEIYKFIYSDDKLLNENDKLKITKTFNEIFGEESPLKYEEIIKKYNLLKFKEDAKIFFNDIPQIYNDIMLEMFPKITKQIKDIENHLTSLSKDEEKIKNIIKVIIEYVYHGGNDMAYAYVYSNANEKLNFCVLPQDCENETVVHELGHVATSFGRNKTYDNKCGLVFEDLDKNRYGMSLNEAVTQRGALKIDKMMRKDGVLIGTDKSYDCPYNCITGLMDEFVDSFSGLLKAYNGSSFDELFDQIGEDNYMRLDDCLTKICNLTNYFTVEEIDEALEYWQRIMHPKKERFVRNVQYVNVAEIAKTPSNEVMKEIKNLKEIYDDIVAYQKNAGTQI